MFQCSRLRTHPIGHLLIVSCFPKAVATEVSEFSPSLRALVLSQCSLQCWLGKCTSGCSAVQLSCVTQHHHQASVLQHQADAAAGIQYRIRLACECPLNHLRHTVPTIPPVMPSSPP